MATFQDRLKEALEMRDMTAAELARISGVNEGAISQYKKGAYKANQQNLEKIAKTLNVSVSWLMGADATKGNVSIKTIGSCIIPDGKMAAELFGKALKTEDGRKALISLIDKAIVKMNFVDGTPDEQELIKNYRRLTDGEKEDVAEFIAFKLSQNKKDMQNTAG